MSGRIPFGKQEVPNRFSRGFYSQEGRQRAGRVQRHPQPSSHRMINYPIEVINLMNNINSIISAYAQTKKMSKSMEDGILQVLDPTKRNATLLKCLQELFKIISQNYIPSQAIMKIALKKALIEKNYDVFSALFEIIPKIPFDLEMYHLYFEKCLATSDLESAQEKINYLTKMYPARKMEIIADYYFFGFKYILIKSGLESAKVYYISIIRRYPSLLKNIDFQQLICRASNEYRARYEPTSIQSGSGAGGPMIDPRRQIQGHQSISQRDTSTSQVVLPVLSGIAPNLIKPSKEDEDNILNEYKADFNEKSCKDFANTFSKYDLSDTELTNRLMLKLLANFDITKTYKLTEFCKKLNEASIDAALIILPLESLLTKAGSRIMFLCTLVQNGFSIEKIRNSNNEVAKQFIGIMKQKGIKI